MRKVLVRLAELVAVLLLVSFGVFLMVALIPGDPAVAILGEGKPPEQYTALRHAVSVSPYLPTPGWATTCGWLPACTASTIACRSTAGVSPVSRERLVPLGWSGCGDLARSRPTAWIRC